MPGTDRARPDGVQVARRLAAALEQRGCEYALGGAIALGYWGEPRGTIDVDLTVYLRPEDPGACVELLRAIGCHVNAAEAIQSLRENGFCRVTWGGVRVDVFLPTIPFYEEARKRRRRVRLDDGSVMVWDAETLTVFKMMIFRLRDIADVEHILRVQGQDFDGGWVTGQLQAMYGVRDPRLARWKDLAAGNQVL